MSREDAQVRQVLVAFGPSQIPRETLEAAAELAARLGASVRALLVEESWLERGAEHPVTAELCIASRTIRPWDPDTLRLQLRVRADQARHTVRQLAEARGLRFSFEVMRGEWPAVVAQASGADVLTAVISGALPGPPASERARVELASVLRQTRGVTLIHRQGRIQRLPVVVYYTGSPSSRRALAIVAALDRGSREVVRVLLPPADAETSMRLVGEVERWRRDSGLQVVTQQLASARPADLARTLLQLGRSLVVLPARSPALRGPTVRAVLDSASAVLVVRGS
jgi:hypothetical protein